MRVVLVRPPSIVSKYAVAAFLSAPLGVAYVAAALRRAGHQVRVVDGVGEGIDSVKLWEGSRFLRGLTFEEVARRIEPDTDVIGVSCMFSSDWPFVRRLIQVLRRVHPSALIIGGGEHFTAAPESSLRGCPDIFCCVLGEGEETVCELLDALSRGKDLSEVPGVAYRDQGGIPRRSAPRERLRAVDDIAWPAWDLVPLSNYLARGHGIGVKRPKNIPILATRGCPYQCTFCSSVNMWTTRWIPRDPEKVLDEVEYYKRRYDIEGMEFFDLTAIVRKEWILRFAQGMKRRGVSLEWQIPVGTRSEALDREAARAMISTGCFSIAYAPESGSAEVLKRVKKRVDLNKMKQSMAGCLKEGMNVKCNMMLGFPGETHHDVRRTLRFIFEISLMGVHDVSVYPFSPYPGSPLFEELRQNGKIPGALTDSWYLSLAYGEPNGMKSYSEHYGRFFLRFYQFLSYVVFYIPAFLLRPWRPWKMFFNVRKGRHESRSETILEQWILKFGTGYSKTELS